MRLRVLFVEEICKRSGLSYVYKDRYVEELNKQQISQGEKPRSIGSTELGRIIASSNGLVDGSTIQVPTTGYHTMEESASWESVEAFIQVLSLLQTEVRN